MNWKRGDVGTGVKLIQEWLCLRLFGVLIDGRFGAATEHAVKLFQRRSQLPGTGIVDDATWDALIEPYRAATAPVIAAGVTFSEAVASCAERHLDANAREIGGQNRGPWVRLYMSGREGKPYAWCAGFATYCIHQAAVSLGAPAPLPRAIGVPRLVKTARARNRLVLKPSANERAEIARGSLFVVRGGKYGWSHVGIVTSVETDVFYTIEGNSNDDLQTNSYEVCRRIRSFEFETKDFVALS